jgi:predicted HicB family RNase H-like nuclease
MIYRGYTAWYAHESQEDVLYGCIAGIHDMFTFVAPTLEDLEREFHAAVDDYLSFCAEKGREPDPAPDGVTPLEASYKGFTGSFEVDPQTGVLHGHVDGIDDIVTFEADRLWDLERKFRDSVDEYLASCAEDAVAPSRAYAESTRATS